MVIDKTNIAHMLLLCTQTTYDDEVFDVNVCQFV